MSASKTPHYIEAARRLAIHMGFAWDLDNATGGAYRRWRLCTPEGKWYHNSFSSMELLAHLVVIANWSEPAGYGMSHYDILQVTGLDMNWKLLLLEKNHSWEIDEIIRLLRKGTRKPRPKVPIRGEAARGGGFYFGSSMEKTA